MKSSIRTLTLARLTLALLAAGLLLEFSPPLQAASSLGNIRRGIGAVSGTTKSQSKKKRNKDGEVSKNTDEKWYLQLTGDYFHPGKSYLDKLYGATFSFGWRISQEDKVQIDIGCSSGNFSDPLSYKRDFVLPGSGGVFKLPSGRLFYGSNIVASTVNLTGPATAKVRMFPLFISYSYCIPLPGNPDTFLGRFLNRFEFRLSPSIGVFGMKTSWTLAESTGTFVAPGTASITFPDLGTITRKVRMPAESGSDPMKFTFAAGAGVGLTINLTSRLYIDLGYRFYWVNHVSNSLPANNQYDPDTTFNKYGDPVTDANYTRSYGNQAWNGTKSWNSMNIHHYAASLGWKF